MSQKLHFGTKLKIISSFLKFLIDFRKKMFHLNFFSNNSAFSSLNQNSISSLKAPSDNSFGTITNMELYPRRRQTEFYYERQPMEDYQSRYSEHPYDKLEKSRNTELSPRGIQEERPKRINPPRNSDMRMWRDSYYS